MLKIMGQKIFTIHITLFTLNIWIDRHDKTWLSLIVKEHSHYILHIFMGSINMFKFVRSNCACLFDLILYIPVNNFSVMLGLIFLG